MIFEYDENNLDKFENFKGGEKYIEAKMYFDGLNRFMIGHISMGGSVGEHVHETNSEVIYVISGNRMKSATRKPPTSHSPPESAFSSDAVLSVKIAAERSSASWPSSIRLSTGTLTLRFRT